MALVWALFASVVTAGIVVAGTTTFLAVDKIGTAEFRVDGQARSVAEAGLTDALAWFRRQTVQPVSSFAPQRNLAVVPVINETDDPTVGIVREYEINMPSLWGRYEVRKSVAAETWTDGNANGRYDFGEAFTDSNGNGKRDPARYVEDVTAKRGLAGTGGVWRVESKGMIYRRGDQTKPLGDVKNPLLASVTVASEIRRLLIVPPTTAALCARTGASVTIGARSSIVGGTKTGLAYKASTGAPAITAGTVTGTPATGTLVTWNDTVDQVFGAPITTLKGMSDASWTTPASFPSKIGDYTLHIVPGPITFDTARPLRGTGVVLVIGNCTLSASNNSFFNGVLYVQGNLTVRGPAYLRGTVIVTGTVDVAGSGGDFSEIVYDGSMVTQVLTVLGQYRFSTGVYEPSPYLPDGVPDEGGLIRLQKTGITLPGGNLPAALGSSLP
jgi:hypothetical protein